ncbi:unnamed protein product [Acanthoscelides obtectus]|uniref:CCHC-type domain-containing protein n=1 Tax=Acanthoscelides obtectus TaxID=200917 RepID=A0A9P0LK44_ACAOB|nr:unnamed protein product [Acanthoscelides obtectus]CAK1624883.1 SCAN domain-containing protein 3 [Acanthoscelides obtectus]
MAGTGVPPINIEGTADWSSLSRMMNSKGIQFSKARTAGTSVMVFTNTPADYRQLVALLESIKRPFFTYQLKEDRMDQRVIRGLPREMSVNDIKEDLVSQGIADAEVQQMTSRTTKKPLPLFLVKTKMPEKLAEIQRLAMLTVSFERKKKSSEPSQCYRCQRYGHTQRNCRLAERCVKCGEDHNSTSCNYVKFGFTFIEKDELQLPQCVICMIVLSNYSMRPNRFERHLKQQHPTLKLIGLCTDGAPAMTGVRSGLAKKLREKSPAMVSTHCVIHRQALASKTLPQEVRQTLDSAIRIVNSIKSSALNSRSRYASCPKPTCWLAYELEGKVIIFLEFKEKHDFLTMFKNDTFQ